MGPLASNYEKLTQVVRAQVKSSQQTRDMDTKYWAAHMEQPTSASLEILLSVELEEREEPAPKKTKKTPPPTASPPSKEETKAATPSPPAPKGDPAKNKESNGDASTETASASNGNSAPKGEDEEDTVFTESFVQA